MPRNELKTKLARLLHSRYLTARHLAVIINDKYETGISLSKLSLIISSKVPNAHVSTYIKIADVLGVRLDEIVDIDLIKSQLPLNSK